MEGITIQVENNIITINDISRYKIFSRNMKGFYDEFYNKEYPYSTFKQLIEFTPTHSKDIFSSIDYNGEVYNLEFICPEPIRMEIKIIIPSYKFKHDKKKLSDAISNIPHAKAIIEYIDDIVSKINSKENEYIIEDDMKIFETVNLDKLRVLIAENDIKTSVGKIYNEKVTNMYTRGFIKIFSFNDVGNNQHHEVHIIKDKKLATDICNNNPRAMLGVKENDNFIVYIIFDNDKLNKTFKITNMGESIKLNGIIAFNRNQYEYKEINNSNNISEISLKLKPKLFGIHEICKLPFGFSNVESNSKFIPFNINVYNGKTYNYGSRPLTPQQTSIVGILEYSLFVKNNYLYLNIIGFICTDNDYKQDNLNNWIMTKKYTCRVDNFNKLFDTHIGLYGKDIYYANEHIINYSNSNLRSCTNMNYNNLRAKFDDQNGLCFTDIIMWFNLNDIILE